MKPLAPKWASLPLEELLTPLEIVYDKTRIDVLVKMPFITLQCSRNGVMIFTLCCESWLEDAQLSRKAAEKSEALCYECEEPTGLAWTGTDVWLATDSQEMLSEWIVAMLSLHFHPWKLAIEVPSLLALLTEEQEKASGQSNRPG